MQSQQLNESAESFQCGKSEIEVGAKCLDLLCPNPNDDIPKCKSLPSSNQEPNKLGKKWESLNSEQKINTINLVELKSEKKGNVNGPKSFGRKKEQKKDVSKAVKDSDIQVETEVPQTETKLNMPSKKKRNRRKGKNSSENELLMPAHCDNEDENKRRVNSDANAVGQITTRIEKLKSFSIPMHQGTKSLNQPQSRNSPNGRSSCPRDKNDGQKRLFDPTSPQKNSAKKKNQTRSETFEPYWSHEDTLKGLESGELIQGELRINQKNYKEAYISDPDNGQDIAILSVCDRNRGLEGDLVAILIKPKEQGVDNETTQRTAKVVHILKRVHRRVCVGILKNIEKSYAILCPRDHRIPRLQIPKSCTPVNVKQNPSKYRNTLFMAEIISWDNPEMAVGSLLEELGEKGEMYAETISILKELGLQNAPVSRTFDEYLPKIPYIISEEDMKNRIDLRKSCIFTIDPSTAKDLDDAVSVEKIGPEKYKVGVHISDVSYFLKTGTPLEEEVSIRATTIYMVQTVFHMLPQQLCMLCSLLPGQDKLAFSVIWVMDSEGNIESTVFTRSIINSCSQLAYEHAQAIIENSPVELPEIYNGFTPDDIKKSVLMLFQLSLKLKSTRFAGGALRIDQLKPFFKLDENCLPTDMQPYELKESNRLIEEFMLLANISVAEKLASHYPKIAMLRRHPPPKPHLLKKLVESLHQLGIFLEVNTAGSLHQSINNYSDGDEARKLVLNHLCTKPMTRAEYFCNGDDTHHYALNVPLYTHFTSPIRRYADIVVHRLLSASLDYEDLPSWEEEQVSEFAKQCNIQKYSAKRAGEMSWELFRTLYIKNKKEVPCVGVVFHVTNHAIDLIIMKIASVGRIYTEQIDAEQEFNQDGLGSSLVIKWKGETQVIQVFSLLNVILKPANNSTGFETLIIPPQAATPSKSTFNVTSLPNLGNVNSPQAPSFQTEQQSNSFRPRPPGLDAGLKRVTLPPPAQELDFNLIGAPLIVPPPLTDLHPSPHGRRPI